MKYIRRELEDTFLEANKTFKVVLVTGARQIGKSTMLTHLAKNQNRSIVSMDRQSYRELAKSDPELFFQTFKPPILIDEIQKCPELFEQIKIICDATDERGLFWLTGSQSKKLMDHAEESLAGRMGVLRMFPFSTKEKLGLTQYKSIDFSCSALLKRKKSFPENNIQVTFDMIWHGGMPDTQSLNEKMMAVYFESYIDSYLLRDAVDDNGIKDTEGFRKFLRACAAFTGQLLNYSDLANAADISQKTAKEWIGILQNMGIIYLLEPYTHNELKRMIKKPKLYFCDTGLCAYLSSWTTKGTLMNGAVSGHYYENYVIMEMLKNCVYHSSRGRLSFYRDRDAREIDIIYEDEQGIHPLEIKKSAAPNRSEIKKFSLIEKTAQPLGSGGIICMCDQPFPIDRNNCFIPSNLI